VGPSHALERRIGASYGVPHGYTSCVAFASSLKVARYRVPEHRWRKPEEAPGGDPVERVCCLVAGLDVPGSPRDVGVPEEGLEEIAREFGDGKEGVPTILRAAYQR
jgi:maleylacetate reductase